MPIRHSSGGCYVAPRARLRRRRVATCCTALALVFFMNLNAVALADPPAPVPDPVPDVTGDLPVGDVGEAAEQVGDVVDGVTGSGSSPPAAPDQSSPAADGASGTVGGAVGQVTTGGDQGQSQSDGGQSDSNGSASGTGAPATQSGVPPNSTGSATGSESNSTAAEVGAGEHSVASVGHTEASHGPNGESSAGASPLAVLGHEIIGTHSSSSGASGSHATTGLAAHAVCEVTGGDVCLALLYGNAESGPNGASADGVLLGACVGGEQNTPSGPCNGPINVEVGQSSSSASGYSSTLVGACFGGHGGPTEPCSGIGATLLSADGAADGSRDEIGASVEMGGHPLLTVAHPGILNCTELVGACLLFNDGAITPSAAQDESTTGGSGNGLSSASASGSVVQIALGEGSVAEVGGSGATADGDGSSADATVVSVLGHEVIGSHATADNGSSQSETGYLTETCDASDGRICMAALFGQASASSGDGASEGSSDTALGSACLGGSQGDPTQNCDGVVGATVAESHSHAATDGSAGSATADQWSNGAAVCVGGETGTGTCDGLGSEILHSESHSAAATGTPASSDADSSSADLQVNGEDAISVGDGMEIPNDCPVNGSPACVVLNDIGTQAATGATTGSAAAATAGLIGSGTSYLIAGGVSESLTGASASEVAGAGTDDLTQGANEPGGNEPGGNEPGGDEPGGNEPGDPEPGGVGLGTGVYTAADGRVRGSGTSLSDDKVSGASGLAAGSLPFTGPTPVVPFAAGLILIGLGTLVWAAARTPAARGHN
jgi:hypothetical protein